MHPLPRPTVLTWIIAALILCPAGFLSAQPFDLLLQGGKIVDGSGNPWFVGDVAITGERITKISRAIHGSATRVIDAGGLVVAPGFVDIHSHSDWLVLEDGHAQSKIRQGVTTEILGEGNSPGPFQGKIIPRPVAAGNRSERISTLSEYFRVLERVGVSVNLGSYVGLGNVWQCVMGESFQRPTAKELDRMKELLEDAMEHGALGLSSMLMMPPGSLATTDELVALCEIVHRHGGIFSSHIRDEGLGIFTSVRQVIEVARRAQVPLDIIHLKIADEQYWGRMPEVVAMIEEARHQGVNVQANVYPYTRGNNNLASIIPPWAHEGGTARMLERLQHTDDRIRMKRDIHSGLPGWYNHFTAVGKDWSRMLVSADNEYKGQTMDRILMARMANKNPKPDPLDELFDLLIEQNGSVPTVYAHHTETDMTLALQQPWCSIGSDGSAYAIEGLLRRGNPHPRNFGTFPRVLGRYVREQSLLTLEKAIRKMTSLNATKVGLRDRGTLAEGFYADVTIFDEKTIIDRSTYSEPFQYNEGIKFVIVNGQVVLDHDRHTGARPGKALRRP